MLQRSVYTALLLAGLLLAILPAGAQEAPATKLEVIAETDDTITVRHELGETEIARNPERIVAVTGTSELEALLALGVQPVAAAGDDSDLGETVWVSHLEPLVEGVERLPSRRNTNLELVLAANPDLIIGSASWIGEIYDDLNAIAPTVALDFNQTWEGVLRDVALLVNKTQEAESIIDAYNARVDALAEQYRPALEGMTYTQIKSFISAGDIQLYSDSLTSAGPILNALGMVQPPEQIEAAGETGSAAISLEQVDLFDTDVIFLYRYPGPVEQEEIDQLRENPLFAGFEAVREGRVYEVNSSWWYLGGPIGIQQLLDDLEQTVLPSLTGVAQADVCEPGYRLFTHAMGETCIPEQAERVVVLDTGELDNALALGAPVVGAPVNDAAQYQAYLADQLEGISDIGAISEPNLEAILALSPDLILGSKQRYEAIYEQLSQIAPTVLTESLRVPWQDNFLVHAEALGRTEEAEALLAEYEAHVADVQAVLGDALDTTTISIIRFRPGQVRLYLKSSYIGYILQDVGLQRPPSQDEDVFSAEISLEQVQDVDADYIFITGYDFDDSEQETFLNSPLWQTLSAVQNGRAIDVNDDTWIAGLGVQAANLVLDDLEMLLAPEGAQASETAEAAS